MHIYVFVDVTIFNYISHVQQRFATPPQCIASFYRLQYRKVGHRVALRRNKTVAMLGQAVRRFTTSAVRSSHYAEGPGKVTSVAWHILLNFK